MKVEKTCLICKINFESKPSAKRKYCSMDCRDLGIKKTMKHKYETKELTHLSTMDKTGVNNPFYGKKHIKETKERFRELSLKRVGPKAQNWQGGKTSENERLRHSDKYNQWRKRVFERDEYICQWCNKNSVTLRAHHINFWSTYPEKRFDINNGITLCDKDHKEIHIKQKYLLRGD